MSDYLNDLKTLMQEENLNSKVISMFEFYYNQVRDGVTGLLSKDEIKPPSKLNIVEYSDLSNKTGSYLDKLAVIKLNGGLGTSMGLTKAKSLLPVKGENTFLDLIAKQIMHLRKVKNNSIPLILMDSFNTQIDTLNYLKKYDSLKLDDLPLDFVQNKFPKIKQSDLSPLENPDDSKNWNPPGHGDIYIAMAISGVMDTLLQSGLEYIFVSNSDNLGAVVDESILTYMIDNSVPFIMEVCNRTEMDKKGGHLSETNDGRLILRETAQCPPEEVDEFQNINTYKYFNTNNLWIDLKALREEMGNNNGQIFLPIILNKKVVDDVPVYQIETAMGAAVNLFEGAKAVVVPRSRFSPVKKTNDLLGVWSDAYEMTDDHRIVLKSDYPPEISLDQDFYSSIDQLLDRVEFPPSLIDCKELTVEGDHKFGKNLKFIGKVHLKTEIPKLLENTEISG